MQRLLTAIEPVVQHGVQELQQGAGVVHTLHEVALMSALVGAGASAATAIGQVEQAEDMLLGRGAGEAWEYGYSAPMGIPYGKAMAQGVPMPYGKGAATMPYGKGAAVPYGKGMTMPFGKGAAAPYGKSMAMPYGKTAFMPYGKGTAVPYGKGTTMPFGKGAVMPYGKGMPVQWGVGAIPMMTQMPLGWR